MKKVLPCVLLIAVLMCACGETADFSLVPATAQEAAQPSPAAVPVPESTPEKVEIFDVFYDAGYYSDNVGNEWQYTLRIPGIRASGTDAAALNERMYSDLIPSVQDAQDAMAGKYSLVVCRVDYVIHVNGGLISIVAAVDTDWGLSQYYVYCFDASTRSIVDRAELLARHGMSEEEFYALGAQIVDRFFQDNYGNIQRDEFWNDRHDKSTARENFVDDCQVYEDDSGELHMIVKLYSFAGADSYYRDLPLA